MGKKNKHMSIDVKEEYFDAHIGHDGSKNHIRPYTALICSNCRGRGIDFKITKSEFDRFFDLLNNNEDKSESPTQQGEPEMP